MPLEYEEKRSLEYLKKDIKDQHRQADLNTRKAKVDHETKNKLEVEEHRAQLKAIETGKRQAHSDHLARQRHRQNQGEFDRRQITKHAENTVAEQEKTHREIYSQQEITERSLELEQEISRRAYELEREITNRIVNLKKADILHDRDMSDRYHQQNVELESVLTQKEIAIRNNDSALEIDQKTFDLNAEKELKHLDVELHEKRLEIERDDHDQRGDTDLSRELRRMREDVTGKIVLTMAEMAKMKLDHKHKKDFETHKTTLQLHFGELSDEKIIGAIQKMEADEPEAAAPPFKHCPPARIALPVNRTKRSRNQKTRNPT